jgi:hypothetical protein
MKCGEVLTLFHPEIVLCCLLYENATNEIYSTFMFIPFILNNECLLYTNI